MKYLNLIFKKFLNPQSLILNPHSRGFTLIEMLIVIAIISILSSVFLVGLGGFRGSAQDTRRIADLQKIQSYLELFYMKYRCYPYQATALSDDKCASTITIEKTSGFTMAELQTAFTNADMKVKVPNDPIYDSTNPTLVQYMYAVSSDAQGYVLRAQLNEGNSAFANDDDGSNVNGIDCEDSNFYFCVKY